MINTKYSVMQCELAVCKQAKLACQNYVYRSVRARYSSEREGTNLPHRVYKWKSEQIIIGPLVF